MQEIVLILHSDVHVREKLEGLLQRRGFVCISCRNAVDAQKVVNHTTKYVVLVSPEELGERSFRELSKLFRSSSQVIAISSEEPELQRSVTEAPELFYLLNVNKISDLQIELIVRRAFDHADALESRATQIDRVYRSIFESLETLQSASSISILLEATCREIAINTGFKRATIVLGDDKFRVKNFAAHSTEKDELPEREDVIGRPLIPYSNQSKVVTHGAGIGFSSVQSEPDGRSAVIVFPIERNDGVIFGFLSLEENLSENADFESLSWPIKKLLKLVSFLIETQNLQSDYRNRKIDSESMLIERNMELRQAQERFSRLVSLTDDIIYMTDAYGRITYLNDSFSQLLGYTRENYIGHDIHKVFSELSNEDEQSRQIVESLESRIPERLAQEIQLFTKSGYRKWFSVIHHWIRQGGEIVAGQGLMRDVTEPNELRSRLARTERFELAGKLATGVAHEINNPLQAIASHLAGIVDRFGNDSSAAASMNIVSESVERIRLLTRSLMDLQRTESSSRSIESVNIVVEKSIALMHPQIRNANIDVHIDTKPDLPASKINVGEISQVLINLILNAIDAMPLGGKLIVTTDNDDRNVILKVADTGKGIPMDVLGSLFQPFASFREQGGGLGMGLYMSHNIVLQHGGKLEADSPPGKGAVFTMTLPIANK